MVFLSKCYIVQLKDHNLVDLQLEQLGSKEDLDKLQVLHNSILLCFHINLWCLMLEELGRIRLELGRFDLQQRYCQYSFELELTVLGLILDHHTVLV